MTVENHTKLSQDNPSNWMPHARRQGEGVDLSTQPQPAESADSEIIFPMISAPPIWPRVFPGL